MKLKLMTTAEQSVSMESLATKDLVASAEECFSAWEDLLRYGGECNELVVVMDNIDFARTTIAAHGAKWYIDNCDPLNSLGQALNVAQEALSVAAIDASMEGLVKTVCAKISEWIHRFINWITSFFKSSNNSTDNKKSLDSGAKSDVAEIKTAVQKDSEKAKTLAIAEVPVLQVGFTPDLAEEIKNAIMENSAAKKDADAIDEKKWLEDHKEEAKPIVKLPVIPPVKLADYSKLFVKIKKVGDDAAENANGVAGHMVGISQLVATEAMTEDAVYVIENSPTTSTSFDALMNALCSSIKSEKMAVSVIFNGMRKYASDEFELAKAVNEGVQKIINECKKLPMIPSRKDKVTAEQIGIKTPADLEKWIKSTESIIAGQGRCERQMDRLSKMLSKVDSNYIAPFKTDASNEAVSLVKFAHRYVVTTQKLIGTGRFVSKFACEMTKFANAVTKSVKGHVLNSERELNENRGISTTGASSAEEPQRMAARMR